MVELIGTTVSSASVPTGQNNDQLKNSAVKPAKRAQNNNSPQRKVAALFMLWSRGIMRSNDPFNLQRFVDVQNRWYERVCAELSQGHKQSHWMWFIFPQLKGLGSSAMANLYGISGLQEAEAYLGHPLLGPRLRNCTQLVLLIQGRSIDQIFDDPDDLKFRSSMTLFAKATSDSGPFQEALKKYFGGKPDPLTLKLANQRL